MDGARTAFSALLTVLVVLGTARAEELRVRRPLPPRRVPVSAAQPRKALLRTAQRSSLPSDSQTVDLLIAYDRGARLWADWKGGGITNFARTAVERSNAALTNSLPGTACRFRLVDVVLIDAHANDVECALDAVTEDTGSWSVVRECRDRCGADIAVTLINTGSAYDMTGISYALEKEGELPILSDLAFAVCAIMAVAESHTMTHELGHLLGAGHSDRQLLDSGPQFKEESEEPPCSCGYYFSDGERNLRTIMAYDEDGYGGLYEEVPYFSTPRVLYSGVPLGTATNDNARTVARTFPWIAAFRSNYEVRYGSGGGGGAAYSRFVACETVAALDGCSFSPPGEDLRFAGWVSEETGRRYDDRLLIFNAADPGERLTLTAVWEKIQP